MTTVAVLGGGAGGSAAAVDLIQQGHRVRLWNRREATIAAYRQSGIRYDGVLGHGMVRPDIVTTELPAALEDADVAVVCLPAIAHGQLADDLAASGVRTPLVLNPGHTGGSLHLHASFAAHGAQPPATAELSTLTYVARRHDSVSVTVSGKAARVHAACLPGGAAALEAGLALFPAARPVADVLATGLANINAVLHPPGAVLAAAWVEATGGDFTFYVEAMTPGVARTIGRLDAERRAVAEAFGHRVPGLLEEMAAIGTVERHAAAAGDVAAAIRSGQANARITAPTSFAHRYYREDFSYGLLPLIELARAVDLRLPVAESLLELGCTVTGQDLRADGLDAARMGIEGLDRDHILALVRSGHVPAGQETRS